MYMCWCTCASMDVCIYVGMYVRKGGIWADRCMDGWMYGWMYLRIYGWMYGWMKVSNSNSIYVCICASMHLCIYVSMHV